MARLSGERAQPGMGDFTAEDTDQRIAAAAAGFREMFSVVIETCDREYTTMELFRYASTVVTKKHSI
jgi:hypothetical protein